MPFLLSKWVIFTVSSRLPPLPSVLCRTGGHPPGGCGYLQGKFRLLLREFFGIILIISTIIGIWRGVTKWVEDCRRPPALRAGYPWNSHIRVGQGGPGWNSRESMATPSPCLQFLFPCDLNDFRPEWRRLKKSWEGREEEKQRIFQEEKRRSFQAINRGRSGIHGRMARDGHGFPKVSLGPNMPYPSTPCGWATP
jgi:hypothetical protein